MKTYAFKVGGQSFTARIMEYTETKVVVELNGNTYEVELSSEEQDVAPPPAVASRQAAARDMTATAATGSAGVSAGKPEDNPPARRERPAASEPQAPKQPAASGGDVVAPIPGVVKQVLVAAGDQVEESTVTIVLEAMKMENQITARVRGTVTEIAVAPGDSVQEGQVLVRIEVA
jgi:glutaconyl-CoA/methylmalonyl-CoA decarboxylase subunit gamma